MHISKVVLCVFVSVDVSDFSLTWDPEARVVEVRGEVMIAIFCQDCLTDAGWSLGTKSEALCVQRDPASEGL